MSIADSTTTLDTAWSENSFVEFTAGTIASVTEMATEVEDKLKRGTLGATSSPTLTAVQRWLVRAKEELMQVKSFVFGRRYAYADLTEGDYRVSIPPDFSGGAWKVKDQANNFDLIKWSADVFDLKYPNIDDEANGKPRICCIKNMELWVAPPANGTTRLEMEYDRSGDDNTPTDFSFLPEVERFRCCDYALYEACESLEDWEKAKWFKMKWIEGLGRSIKSNSRKRWSNMGFRAVGILERESARYYQS